MARTQPGKLVYTLPDSSEEHIQLTQDVTTLGRSDSCDIVLARPTVSRLHARIELDRERYLLFDGGSANGTFLNGRRIEQGYELHTGDEIWLGSPENSFCFADPDQTQIIHLEGGPPLTIDEQAHSIQLYGLSLALSPLEHRLLVHLASNSGTVCTREACFLAAWGQPYDHATCEDALNNCVSKLRRNLRATAEAASQATPLIVTIPRIGFRLDAQVGFVMSADPQLRERTYGS